MAISVEQIATALRTTGGYVPDAAGLLACSRTNLYRRIKANPGLRRLREEITGRRKAELDPKTILGAFVLRYGLSHRSAAKILCCDPANITKWGSGRAAPTMRIRRLIVALERLTAADLPWPGELQPDPRPAPKLAPLYTPIESWETAP